MGRSLSRNTAADSNGVNAHDGALAGDAGEILVPADTRDAGQANAWYPPALEPQDHRQPVWLPEKACRAAVEGFRSPVAVYYRGNGGMHLKPIGQSGGNGTQAFDLQSKNTAGSLVALLPALSPEGLGHRRFTAAHGCRLPYIVGEMAHGIATAEMVIAAARAGLLGFFGSAGLRPDAVSEAIDQIKCGIPARSPWGMNLIHTPNDPQREKEVAELFMKKGVERISASAFMRLSSHIVRLSASGLFRTKAGTVERRTHIFAKISRPEVAGTFMVPPPVDTLRELAAAGLITKTQAELQSRLPVAEDITIEADSGGHTDNRSMRVVYPAVDQLRRSLARQYKYSRPIRLGAAGGLGTPASVATAFQLGADYVVTGSINQAAIESGLSHAGRKLLAACGIADTAMAPAADMFERGVKVQVLKKGTMFPVRAQRLYDIYRRHDGLRGLDKRDRQWLEADIFASTCEAAWRETRSYHRRNNPALSARAESDPKLQMALTFRRYLFMGAKWAREGNHQRRSDYQIWCGPAMGAFNDWVRDSYLEPLENRTVGQLGANLMEGACIALRTQQLRTAGVDVPDRLSHFTPRPM